ncbi:L-seryl-tRNA(Sec) selenium transferase [uncultured Bartonella sp.]|uniref:L-seryl-tRNA(Sec) selenium transferase n=1 Tax=uncultured Bartonella sp. TaxID=104108 RepID=UPI002616AE9D|nr:L-seryl-tRNA(Sec) selenium transferase [uncultured Bartonella sp.]
MVADFSLLPAVNVILGEKAAEEALNMFGHSATVDAIRAVLADERILIKAGRMARSSDALAMMAYERLQADSRSSMRAVFNLTGTILHTNFGRAQLPETAIAAAVTAMRNAVSLEYDLETGERGERDDHLRDVICELTGAEDATIVNNNAAAVLLVANTIAGNGGETIISRGELIEIGGAFRMPDIMESAGCKLVEVGTTNRTHLADYEKTIGEQTALILKVHTSNYRIEGFSKSVTTKELAKLAQIHNVPLVEDLGSGTLVHLETFGLPHEPTVQDVIKSGADIVTFSGDKLLGGVQAGFIIGKAELIAKINKNPMKRSLRVDKVRLAALEIVLRLYRNEEKRNETIPTLRYLSRNQRDIAHQAADLCSKIKQFFAPDYLVEICPCYSQVGSGAVPAETLPSYGISINAVDPADSLPILAYRLRQLPKPVIGRIHNNRLILDLRCLDDMDGFVYNLSQLS